MEKKRKLPLSLNETFTYAFSIGVSAIMGGLVYLIGKNVGESQGMIWANEQWKNAIDQALKDSKPEEETKED